MKDSPSDAGYGRTNWRRFAVSIGIPLAAAGGLVLAVQQGALAANIVVSGQEFKLSATHLHGDGFTQYAGAIGSQTLPSDGGTNPGVDVIAGMDSATIQNLCQSVTAGPIILRIDAGNSSDPKQQVSATNLLIGMEDLKGDATFSNMQIGVDAGGLSAGTGDGPAGHGTKGTFGQESSTVDIDNLQQTAVYTSAASFVLKGMHLHLYIDSKGTGGHACF